MDGLAITVTLDERKAFHFIDRRLYVLLVGYLSCDPTECLQILGLWLLLERWGCHNAIRKILTSPMNTIKALVDEAITCLKLINKQSDISLEEAAFPLTNRTLEIVLTLQFFCINCDTILKDVQKLVQEICVPALSDLYQQALSRQTLAQIQNIARINTALSSLAHSIGILSCPVNSLGHNSWHCHTMTCMMQPPIQDASVSSEEQVGISPSAHNSSMNGSFWQTPVMSPLIQAAPAFSANQIGASPFPGNSLVHDDSRQVAPPAETPEVREEPVCNRTMFLTFSRGYPVSEEEVRCHLTCLLGNCIEEIHMQEVREGGQSLFATVVFLRAAFLDAILGRCPKVKHTINGKHVWMRKYVERYPGIRRR